MRRRAFLSGVTAASLVPRAAAAQQVLPVIGFLVAPPPTKMRGGCACRRSWFRPFAAAGGLMSYGGDLSDLSRQIGIYAGRIPQGRKAGRAAGRAVHQVELVDQSEERQGTRGRIPPTLLARADEVIE